MSKTKEIDNWDYYKVDLKFFRKVLATCTDVSIYKQHVLEKAKKMIAEANKMKGKVIKALEKYKGDDIAEKKEVMELQGIIRKYQEVLGKKEDIPGDIDCILTYAKKLEGEVDELCKKGEEMKSTVFMRDEDGHAVLSTHMLLGNIKENLKVIVNNTPKDLKVLKSKVAANEVMTLDLKPVEEFMKPTKDVARNEKGKPIIEERPIRFEDNFGKTVTAIAMSEYLPIGSETTCHLRVRKNSPVTENIIEMLLDCGKNNGIGQNRRSGFGQYYYKLEKVENPVMAPEGWN